jgi:hypothetical protein
MPRPTPLTTAIRFGDLVDAIETANPDALERVSSAVLVADHLDDVADQVIGHFVDQARRSGASWTEIGRSMGVTKQAAQKRFAARTGTDVPAVDPQQGFAQFSQRARNAVVAAHNEAAAARNDRISPVHLLLGLLVDADGTGTRALSATGVDLGALRAAATATLPSAAAEVPDLVPYDEDAKEVLAATSAEAQRLGQPYVGTEHVLLALTSHGTVADLLSTAGVDRAAVERGVRETPATAPDAAV